MVEFFHKAKELWSMLPENGVISFALQVILALIVYFVGSKIINHFCKMLKRQITHIGAEEGSKSFLLSLIKISLHILLVMMIAVNLGVDQASVAALIGSAGVAVSLAVQGGLSNFVGGLIILFLRPFVVGDYIIENGDKNEGTVEKIEMYYTTLMTVDSRRIVIPNSQLTSNSITNVTAMERRRLEIKVGISYDSDLLAAKDILRQLIEEDEQLMDKEEVQIFVDELGSSSVVIAFRAWVTTDQFWPTKWRMNEKIKLTFDAKGIKIPYPQMDVHLKTDH